MKTFSLNLCCKFTLKLPCSFHLTVGGHESGNDVTAPSRLLSSAIYEQSCEVYKHRGGTSGHYYVDVDGSGPIGPQLIYCDMTGSCENTLHKPCPLAQTHTPISSRLPPPEDQTWTVIRHNNTELTTVRPQPGKNQHTLHFEYASEEEQLVAIMSQSEHCEQELTYHCRKSRLLNTPGEDCCYSVTQDLFINVIYGYTHDVLLFCMFHVGATGIFRKGVRAFKFFFFSLLLNVHIYLI